MEIRGQERGTLGLMNMEGQPRKPPRPRAGFKSAQAVIDLQLYPHIGKSILKILIKRGKSALIIHSCSHLEAVIIEIWVF